MTPGNSQTREPPDPPSLMAVCTCPPRVFTSSQPGPHPRLAGRIDATAPFHGLSSLILRFPPNFVRQLSTKARRNCSNIGVAQIVAASWSNNNSNSGIPAAPSATAVDAAATAAIPVDPAKLSAGGDEAVFENDVQLEALPDLKEASFLSSDGSLAIHAGKLVKLHFREFVFVIIIFIKLFVVF